jgi:II/X family phage/plasmid replication protein
VIDWLTFVAPCEHPEPITGGSVMSIGPDGSVDWITAKRLSVVGSHDARITVRTASRGTHPTSHVEVSGNPTKWFQGHNLWGTDDLPGLVYETMAALAAVPELGLCPTDADWLLWRSGGVSLSRVDVTESYHLRNRADVLAWLRSAEQSAHLSHRGRGQLVKGSTLYFGKNSRRWSLKLYSKGQELAAKDHKQDVVMSLPSALEWADKSLRAELTLRSMELQRRGLRFVSGWHGQFGVDWHEVTAELLRPVLGDMTMTTTKALPADVVESLRPTHRAALAAWEAGHDLRAMFPRPTFYRHRKALLPYGVDIAVVKPSEPSNVVPMIRILEAVPAQVPAWAHGTPLYFEPRSLRVA